MKHNDKHIIDQYLSGASKRELIKIHKINTITLDAILGTHSRKVKPIIEPKKQKGLYADRDTYIHGYYSALIGHTLRHDEMKHIGIRTNSGYSRRVGKLKALGNGQVPPQAAVAYSILEELFKHD